MKGMARRPDRPGLAEPSDGVAAGPLEDACRRRPSGNVPRWISRRSAGPALDLCRFSQACNKLHAAGHPFGNAISPCNDAATSLAALLAAFGSRTMAADGTITVRSDGTQAALEYMKELVEYMPKDVHEWDNGSNNKWLISGKGAAIFNAPSAWAVAKEDAPEVAAQVWHHDVPSGPGGRYRGRDLGQWGIWTFAENKSAA